MDSTVSIRKQANNLKVYKKTVRTAIKQDLSPDLNPLDYAIRDILENKINATSHPNIGSLKTAIEEEWNKMSEEFILKATKPFRRRVDTIIERNGGHIELIHCFVSSFLFCCLFFIIQINLVL